MKSLKLFQWKYTGANKNKVVLNQAPKLLSVTEVSSYKGAFLLACEEEQNLTPSPTLDNKTLFNPRAAEKAKILPGFWQCNTGTLKQTFECIVLVKPQ